MYPTQELNRLSSQKTRLHRRITQQRNQLAQDTVLILKPLTVLKPYLAVLRVATPIAALVLNLFIRRRIAPSIRKLESLQRWIPLMAGTLRLFRLISQKPG